MKDVESTINANGVEISVASSNEADYISLTEKKKKLNPEFPADVVKNQLRSRSTIEFLGLWEKIYNPDFKLVEFDQFKNAAGENSFVLTPQKWISTTNAIGITSKSGRYGGTYAHSDIAFEFASWISPEFKLYIIKDYQRLKADESHAKSLDWNIKCEITKSNYRIHTDTIKENLIPNLTPQQIACKYASEADLINVALFGQTAKQWRNQHSESKGNIRDEATIEQLIVLANLESLNAEYIREGISPAERLSKLNKIAIYQLNSLWNNSLKSIEKLKSLK